MILYLSSSTEKELFKSYQDLGVIKSGFQAQKFNYLFVTGLACNESVVSIGTLPFQKKIKRINDKVIISDRVKYICIGNNPGIFHRLLNFVDLYRYGKTEIKNNKIEYIFVDSINPVASVVGSLLSKKYHINRVSVVTDLPYYMARGKQSLYHKLTQFLLEKYDYYVLLTHAMNPIANPHNRPYIVIEGLCEKGINIDFCAKKKKSILYTGSLRKNTGIELLIDGFLLTNIKDYTLEICGSGDLSDYIIQMSRKYKNIVFHGNKNNDEIVRLQREATLLINPRPLDLEFNMYSFPSKLMEYLLSGTPVLSSALQGIPQEYFDYMFVLTEVTPVSICMEITKILSLSENERQIIGLRAKSFVEDKKNKYVQAGKVLTLLHSKQ